MDQGVVQLLIIATIFVVFDEKQQQKTPTFPDPVPLFLKLCIVLK